MELPGNVFALLDGTAESDHANSTAFGFEGETRTFRECRDRALAVAGGLHAQGVRPGDMVAVMMGNRFEWVDTFFGLAALGAVCVPVNVLLTGPEISHVCRDSGARFLIADEIAARSLPTVDHEFDMAVAVGEVRVAPAARLVAWQSIEQGPQLPSAHVSATLDDIFVLYYSSGTTGLPKAAVHSHRGVLSNALIQVDGLGLTEHDRYLLNLSFSWAAGFHNLVLTLINLGGYTEIRRTGSATMDNVVEIIEKHEITHTMIVPSLLRELVTREDLRNRISASTLTWIATGAEPVPRSIIESVSHGLPGVALCQGYGLSEFPSMVTILQTDEVFDHEGSAGRALPYTELAVHDKDGTIRTSGRGELLIKSPATMTGYYNRPSQTTEVLRDGWLHTGDVVELDDEGFVTIVGRTKDLIISGGLNVYPKEVEDVILRVPHVREAAVVGVPHERFGETAVAVIVTDEPGFDPVTVDDACSAQLASYKRPRKILVRAEPLPRNANSKLLKRELRPWVAEHLGL